MSVMEIVGTADDDQRLVECKQVERVTFYESLDGKYFVLQLEADGTMHRFHFPSTSYHDLAAALSASRATSEAFRRKVHN